MSLLSDIKFFISKYLDNPVLVVAASYILYITLKKYIKQEGFADSIGVVSQKNGKHVIFDKKLKKYILIGGDEIYSSDKKA